MPCEDETGIPVQKSAVFGKLEQIYEDKSSILVSELAKNPFLKRREDNCLEKSVCVDKTRRLFLTKTAKQNESLLKDDDDSCASFTYRAKTLNLSILLNYQDSTDFISEMWEKDAIIDVVSLWKNQNDTAFLKNIFPNDSNIPETPQPLNLTMSYLTERSIPDELTTETSTNAWIVAVSYGLMFLYVGIALGRFPSKYETTFGLGLLGIVLVGSSVICGYAVVSYLNIQASLISAEVVPFLI